MADRRLRILFSRFRVALRRWRAAGRPVVSARALATRYRACRACPHWTGLSCGHPRCGCTAAKLLLATETCPIDRWPA